MLEIVKLKFRFPFSGCKNTKRNRKNRVNERQFSYDCMPLNQKSYIPRKGYEWAITFDKLRGTWKGGEG